MVVVKRLAWLLLIAPTAIAALQSVPAACHTADSSALAEQARRSLEQKKYEAASGEFQRAFDTCPQQRVLLLELARALTLARRFDDAARAAKEFLSVQPGSEQALLVLANIHFMRQQFAECQSVANRVLATNRKNVAALKLKANAQYLGGEEPAAVETFLGVIQIDPKDEEAIYSLGRIYYQQNRFDPAIAQFRRVLELDPKSYKAYDNLGLCYEALNKEDDAIRHYMKALDLVHKEHREYDWPYANLANLMLKRGENEKAFQLAAEAAERNPQSARNFFLTGKALVRLEKAQLSLKWLERSAELDPAYPEPHYLLGQVYMKLGRREDAQRELQIFQEISSKSPRQRR